MSDVVLMAMLAILIFGLVGLMKRVEEAEDKVRRLRVRVSWLDDRVNRP